MLDRAPRNIVAKGYLRALDAAGQVMVRALWPRVPVDLKAAMNRAHAGKGALVGRLDAFIELDAQFRGGVVDVGFGDLGHIALWLEYGHRMVGHKPGKKQLGDVPAIPFMRPAFDACNEQAVDAFAATLASVVKAEYPE